MSAANASAVSTPSTTSVGHPMRVKSSMEAATSMPPNTAITPGTPGSTSPMTPMSIKAPAINQSTTGSSVMSPPHLVHARLAAIDPDPCIESQHGRSPRGSRRSLLA